MFPSRRITSCSGDKFRDEYSMFFDGVDDCIFFNTPIAGTWNEAIGEWNTICCWFKMYPDNYGTQRIWDLTGQSPGLIFADSGSNWHLGYNTGNSDKLGIQDAQSNWWGIWKHVIMSFEKNENANDTALDDSTAGLMIPLLWVDGVRQTVDYHGTVSDNNGAPTTDQIDLNIGSNSTINSTNSQPFNGWMSDIAGYKVKFDNNMAKMVYNSREPFNHNSWSIGAKYLTQWGRFGDSGGDARPSYGLMSETFTNDESSPGSNDYGNCYNTSNTFLNFVNDSTAVSGDDGYDVVANSAFTNNVVTSLITTDDSKTGLEITNTTDARGTMRSQVTVTSGVVYMFVIQIYDTDSSFTDADVMVKLGNSGGDSVDYSDTTISTDSQIYKNIEFTTSSTQLDIAIGPDSTTSGHKIRIKTIELYEIKNHFTMQDASNYNNSSTGDADGTPLITGDTP